MIDTFEPKSKEEFLKSIDRGIAQLDADLGKDAFKDYDEIIAELEKEYNATQTDHRKAYNNE